MPKSQDSWLNNKVAKQLNPQIFNAFIKGSFPGFRIPNFLSKREAKRIASAVDLHVREYKDAPGVGRVGETLVEHGHNFDEYAELSSLWLTPGMSLPEREHLIYEISGFLTLHTGYPFRILKHGDTECFHGVFRKINNGAGIHIDDVTADSHAFSHRKIRFQASAVLHVATPSNGGETILWDRKPQPEDKAFLLDSWQYSPEMVEDSPYVTVPCRTCDLVILRTDYYHSVSKNADTGDNRVSFSIFLVIFEDEPEVIYIYN